MVDRSSGKSITLQLFELLDRNVRIVSDVDTRIEQLEETERERRQRQKEKECAMLNVLKRLVDQMDAMEQRMKVQKVENMSQTENDTMVQREEKATHVIQVENLSPQRPTSATEVGIIQPYKDVPWERRTCQRPYRILPKDSSHKIDTAAKALRRMIFQLNNCTLTTGFTNELFNGFIRTTDQLMRDALVDKFVTRALQHRTQTRLSSEICKRIWDSAARASNGFHVAIRQIHPNSSSNCITPLNGLISFIQLEKEITKLLNSMSWSNIQVGRWGALCMKALMGIPNQEYADDVIEKIIVTIVVRALTSPPNITALMARLLAESGFVALFVFESREYQKAKSDQHTDSLFVMIETILVAASVWQSKIDQPNSYMKNFPPRTKQKWIRFFKTISENGFQRVAWFCNCLRDCGKAEQRHIKSLTSRVFLIRTQIRRSSAHFKLLLRWLHQLDKSGYVLMNDYDFSDLENPLNMEENYGDARKAILLQ